MFLSCADHVDQIKHKTRIEYSSASQSDVKRTSLKHVQTMPESRFAPVQVETAPPPNIHGEEPTLAASNNVKHTSGKCHPGTLTTLAAIRLSERK